VRRSAMLLGIGVLATATALARAEENNLSTAPTPLVGNWVSPAVVDGIPGLELRMPICSLAASPRKTWCHVTGQGPCEVGADGEPVEAHYLLDTQRGQPLEWNEGLALYGAGIRDCFRHDSQYDFSLGARVSSSWGTNGSYTSEQERRSGVPIARMVGFVNIDDALVRGTVRIVNATGDYQLFLQTYADGEWTTVAGNSYTPSQVNTAVVREIEAVVPNDNFVRFEVRLVSSDAHGRSAIIQDMRFFGAQCYPDNDNEPNCL